MKKPKKPDNKDARPVFGRLAACVFHHKRLFWGSAALILVNAAATLAPAEWGQYAVQTLEKRDFGVLPLFALAALGIIIVKEVTDFLRRFMMNWLGQKVAADMQRDFHDKILRLPMAYFRRNEIGELLSRTTNDITNVRTFLGQNLPSLLKDPLVILIALVMLFLKNWIFTLELLVVGILIVATMHVIGGRIRRVARRVQERIGKAVARMQESLFSIDIIKVFHREDYHREKFNRAIRNYLRLARREIRLDALGTPVNEFLSFLAAFIIVGTGLFMISAETMAPGELIAFILYLAILAQPIGAFTTVVLQYKKVSASATRIFEVLDEDEEDAAENFPDLPPVAGRVDFRAIRFAYRSGHPVFRGLSLSIAAGETIALVGSSGCGKTTLVNMIARLYDPDKGRVLVDSRDVRTVNLASLRRQIGYVTQESFLFPGSIRENILYGRPDATDAEIREAARLAHAEEFIRKLPGGYASRIGERGALLSGGQRQRLALARVLLRRPRILVLDEATSALDAESERHVQRALESILHKQTTIIIAHRLATVRKADRIIVMDQGRILESGSHDDLMARTGSRYKALFALQHNT